MTKSKNEQFTSVWDLLEEEKGHANQLINDFLLQFGDSTLYWAVESKFQIALSVDTLPAIPRLTNALHIASLLIANPGSHSYYGSDEFVQLQDFELRMWQQRKKVKTLVYALDQLHTLSNKKN